jgi:hypothetical protein
MQSGAGYFSASKEIRYGCMAVMVNRDAAADIMSGRSDGNRLRRDVNAVLQAFIIDIGETFN